MAQKEYLRRNKATYDRLAKLSDTYTAKYAYFYPRLLRPFEDVVSKRFGKGARVIDLGCGVGLAMRILSDNGFSTYGIDFSPKRVRLARKNSPSSKVLTGNFLTKRSDVRFHGIMMISSFHLFPTSDVPLVLERLRELLLPGGYCLISIGSNTLPRGKEHDEGYFPKTSAPNAVRFMTRYTERGFRNAFKNLEWGEATKFYKMVERRHLNETWMCVIIRKYHY
ncbi:MAG: methyltransferase domain-containing protein [Candidatus Micrarchaeota archaeon]|nr:methyltransferase domain-containing protein [Candidatus Micrarchaeota archaeon]